MLSRSAIAPAGRHYAGSRKGVNHCPFRSRHPAVRQQLGAHMARMALRFVMLSYLAPSPGWTVQRVVSVRVRHPRSNRRFIHINARLRTIDDSELCRPIMVRNEAGPESRKMSRANLIRLALVLALLLLLRMHGAAAHAQDLVGDVAAGRRLVAAWCSECHALASGTAAGRAARTSPRSRTCHRRPPCRSGCSCNRATGPCPI